ncbi:class I SAM-dependent methyltransferase [Oceanicella actignis]|uniref:Methyltransferase domain-containing protein n=1 Tax=Oceanicella actignis TaxID=1189325 RepID=A0A1M7TH56_9RHOB|nr:methyltransferase domain-containing protein [Oceanicella actignis]TYO88470.1 methyltransferase family protein [Oceanicella actignis]SET59292.1 Methyltransferase domain-containing protein [Oceanicella actignis]SHN70045.1 Methyltransferase domain-containing protein [Oceanicella actignis]
MHLDVVQLRRFYYRTQLGRAAQRALREAMAALWPSARGETVVGFGFAAPLLRPYMAEAARTLCLMPAPQGVCPWPAEGPNVSVLVEETHWPLPVGFADRLIVAHGLESCARPDALLEEMRRVLAPGGKVMIIAPNRSGMWARSDATPFGYGRPYSAAQLDAALAAHGFEPERHAAALFGPPSHRRFWLKTHQLWERAGRRLGAHRLAGAVLVEATRTVYALPRGRRERARASIEDVLAGLAGRPRPAPDGARSHRAGAGRAEG